ncbi:MAG: class IV adenylate cyclase [bacterium]
MAANIELKARCGDLNDAQSKCEALGAHFAAVLRQTDTYFRVATGRLKLRQIEGQEAELIGYQRDNHTDARASEYLVAPQTDPSACHAALGKSLGILCVVRKERRLYLWENVRIHLDRVEGLGEFIEFEAVVSDENSREDGFKKIAFLRDHFSIRDQDLVSTSYSDLLIQSENC